MDVKALLKQILASCPQIAVLLQPDNAAQQESDLDTLLKMDVISIT